MCKIIEDEGENQPERKQELERESHRLREKMKHIIKKNKDKKMKSNLTKEEERGREKASKNVLNRSCNFIGPEGLTRDHY